MVKAYAITTIHRKGKDGKLQVVPASTPTKVSVFDAEQTEFDNLAALNGVRKATKEEIALFKAQAEVNGNAAFDTEDEASLAGTAANTSTTAMLAAAKPDSGAEGDPSSSPKKSAASKAKSDSSKDDDLNL
ncbi:MAG: hypothetical protein DI537_19155 [Stutzerimonas stutzeri]|nr:MAG: hypothetical protein DI537_19155 [Stutzerimonas stutzeri]